MASTEPSPNARTATWDFNHLSNFMMTLTEQQTTSETQPRLTINGSDVPADCRVVTTEFTYIPWNNPSNIVSVETGTLIAKLLTGVLVPVMAFVGLIVNVLNALVFYKQGLRERVNLLLFSLALSDFLVEVEMLYHTMEFFYTLLSGQFTIHGPVMRFKQNKTSNFLYGMVYVSAFLSTLIACERCLCISHPFKAKQILKTRTAGVIVVVATIIISGAYYIIGDKFRIGCVHYVRMKLTQTAYIPSPFYLRHPQLVDVLNGVVYGVALPCFFVTTTTVTTIITIVKLRTAAAWRQSSTSHRQEDKQEVAVTKTLMAVSCLFVACTLPNIVLRIVPFFSPDFQLGGRRHNIFMSSVVLLHVTPTINSCLNFFFYVYMGSRFRQTLYRTCCPRRTLEKPKEISTVTTVSGYNCDIVH